MILDTLFIPVFILALSALNTMITLFSANDIDFGFYYLEQGFIISIVIYFISVIFYILYGWKIRRWFIINKKDQGDNALTHLFKFFLPLFGIILIYTIIVYLTIFRDNFILITVSTNLLQFLQIAILSSLIGIFTYPKIEQHLGLLIHKEIILPDDRKIGLGSLVKQSQYSINKLWKNSMVVVAIMLVVSNFLVFIVFPSIPSDTVVANLSFTYPNFFYSYKAELGFRQEFFVSTSIPSKFIVDWKLTQSLMCFALFGITILLFYLPRKDKKLSLEEVPSDAGDFSPEESMDDIAFNILSPDIQPKEYSPPSTLPGTSKNRTEKFFKRIMVSDIIPVMNLACLNLALASFIIIILLNLGIPIASQIDINYDVLYVQLSQLYWAGFNEEITYRFLLFGLPLFILNGIFYGIIKLSQIMIKRNKKNHSNSSRVARYIFEKKPKNPLFYLTGRWKKLGLIDFLFLLFSSYSFGYVHYQLGYPYWQEGKIFQAAVAGLIFGYAFYKYGLHAAIFLHVVNNFVLGMLLTPNLGLILNGEILVLLITALGALYLIYSFLLPLSAVFNFINNKLGRTKHLSKNNITSETG
ncbi:MAG: CPBP family intramembrane metalloprotease [Asgard group archaeon]|nr:CPBP family intramembrane metalloprotease [Asgard group archaeon]